MTEDSIQQRIADFIEHATSTHGLNLLAGACIGTTTGAREQNQDRAIVLFANYPTTPQKNFVLGVVCDGIGGSSYGEEAAVLSLSTFVSSVIRKTHLPGQERLNIAAMAANDIVYRTFRGRSGSTLAAVMVTNDAVFGTSAGDSRIYGVTSTGELKQLTRDDTMADVLGHHGDVDYYKNQLVQHIGMGEGIQPQLIKATQQEFSKFLLTSDGIHAISKEAFRDVSRFSSLDQDYVHRLLLLNEALAGKDNGTAMLLSATMEISHIRPIRGLNLKFLSPFDHLEIWIPVLVDRVQQASLSPELLDIIGTDPQHPIQPALPVVGNTPATQGKARGKKPKGPNTRSNKRRKPASEAQSPPDEADPPLEIRFPDDEEK